MDNKAEQKAIKTKVNGASAMRLFFALMGKWKLEAADQKTLLGEPADRTFTRWKSGEVAALSIDTLDRVGILLGIHSALRILFTNPENLYGWIVRDNAHFGGVSPKQTMLAGRIPDLQRVRDYLDHARGGK